MLPTIALIVSTYAIARLIQIPFEAIEWKARWVLLAIISVPAIGAIAFLCFTIVLSGTTGASALGE